MLYVASSMWQSALCYAGSYLVLHSKMQCVEHNSSWNFKGAAGAMRSTPTFCTTAHQFIYTLTVPYCDTMYNIIFLYIRSNKMHHLQSLSEKAVVVYSFEHICPADSSNGDPEFKIQLFLQHTGMLGI